MKLLQDLSYRLEASVDAVAEAHQKQAIDHTDEDPQEVPF
jgi:hypothetical protein